MFDNMKPQKNLISQWDKPQGNAKSEKRIFEAENV